MTCFALAWKKVGALHGLPSVSKMILNNVGRACDVKLYLGHSSLLLIRTSLDVDVEHGLMASEII